MVEKQHKMVGSEPTLSQADLMGLPATLEFKGRLYILPTKCQSIHTRLLQYVIRQVRSVSTVLYKPSELSEYPLKRIAYIYTHPHTSAGPLPLPPSAC